MLEIAEANPNEPFRVMIYGPEGAGKSTFGALSDKPIFISPESGINRLKDSSGNPVKYFKGISTFDDVLNAIKYLKENEHDFETVVVDSADWVESVCHAKICGSTGKDIIRVNGGFGAGYRDSQAKHKSLITRLEDLRVSRKMNIIVTAHAHVRTVKDPDASEDYDAFEIKCHEYVSSLWREWVDALFFARFATYIKTGEDSTRARAYGDDTRLIFTTKRPAFQAKNRFDMPHELEFDMKFYETFKSYALHGPKEESLSDVYNEIIELTSHVKNKETQEKIMETVNNSKDDKEELNKIRNRVKEITGKKGA